MKCWNPIALALLSLLLFLEAVDGLTCILTHPTQEAAEPTQLKKAKIQQNTFLWTIFICFFSQGP